MANNDRARSLARESVAASRAGLAGVKLELGIILLICLGVAAGVLALDYPNWLELLVLGAVGFVCGGYLAVRTRSVAGGRDGGDGSRQE